ncbi:MAG TPA: Ig-like domain-containing protein [Myxococcota bacterium]|nr:Ig-like domain-containing protein [Myxococcota bacterium]HNH46089.1 Ig-like domain-containing protein [Myxococcota bacterium]
MLSLLLLAPLALANGQTSHAWISVHALEHLPPGELRDFLRREDLQPMLINGTMFPDGGYPQDDDYGEMAHWEPFQSRYRDWILAQEQAPYSDAMAQHVAFYLGMSSHGMADQVYDSLFMERAKQHDAASDWATYSMDEATDVAYASLQGPFSAPEDWVPYDTFLQLYTEAGHPVTQDLLATGQSLLRVAIGYVGASSQVPATVAKYEARFPWATTHQDDPEAYGNPGCEGAVIARYWQVLWDRLQENSSALEPVLQSFPSEGKRIQSRDHTLVESRVSLVFSRGIDTNILDSSLFHIRDEAGQEVPVELRVFYGYSSHVVHLIPLQDWAADMDYTITVDAGVPTFEGDSFAGYSGSFTTREETASPAPEDDNGCSTAASGGWSGALLGLLLGLRRRRRAQ